MNFEELSSNALAAALIGGTEAWGVRAHVDDVRYFEPLRYRRKCHCGCAQWATHRGCANGIILMAGCELSVRRWVRG